jgi:hypothetical protein
MKIKTQLIRPLEYRKSSSMRKYCTYEYNSEIKEISNASYNDTSQGLSNIRTNKAPN